MHTVRKPRLKMYDEDRAWLRETHREPNQRLAEYLGHDVPWDQGSCRRHTSWERGHFVRIFLKPDGPVRLNSS